MGIAKRVVDLEGSSRALQKGMLTAVHRQQSGVKTAQPNCWPHQGYNTLKRVPSMMLEIVRKEIL